MHLCENLYITYTVKFALCQYFPINVTELQFESCAHRKCYALSSALNLFKSYHTAYLECINTVLKIMLALQCEKSLLRKAILKYTWLLTMRRIGVIMYDQFVLTGFAWYLLSAEVALMFAQHANVFSLVYIATLWYCQCR